MSPKTGSVSPTDQSRGEQVRREVLGDEHVDRAAGDPFAADLQDLLTRWAWGEVWDRPGLSRRERSIATLAVLVALRAEEEIAVHLRGAVRNGMGIDEIKELLLHTAPYAGIPAANLAFKVARETLGEQGYTPSFPASPTK